MVAPMRSPPSASAIVSTNPGPPSESGPDPAHRQVPPDANRQLLRARQPPPLGTSFEIVRSYYDPHPLTVLVTPDR